MSHRLIVFFLGLSLIAVLPVHAQLPSSGRDFYIAMVEPSISCPTIKGFQGFFALISAYYDCNVTVSYFDDSGKEFQAASNHIIGKHYLQLPLDASHMKLGQPAGGVPEFRACHIQCDRPVSVSYYSTGPNSGAMFMVLPTLALGKKYVVASAPTNPGAGAADSRHFACTVDSGSSEFIVIATQNSTNVTITPNGTTRQNRIGTMSGYRSNGTPNPFTVTLQRGQTYTVKSLNDDATNDQSGSMVTADKPIGVIGAHEDAIIGDAVGYLTDERNVLAQQMVPVEFWATQDYLSLPFVESPPESTATSNMGDRYKIYTYDSVSNSVRINSSDLTPINRYTSATAENVTGATNTSSTSGTPIMVEQYDYREMNQTEPYPAPTMMNVIPMQNFVKAAAITVPDDNNQVHKKRYLNLIAPRATKFKLWVNGVGPKSITQLAPASTPTFTIPNHPTMQGWRYELSPGMFVITSDSSFAAYNCGYLGLDPDFDLGDNDDDDYYFEYAAPAAETFHASGSSVPPSITAALNCGAWTVNVRSNSQAPLALVELLKDPMGVILRRPNLDSGYVSTNVDFNPVDWQVGQDSVATATIQVDDPSKNAEAYVVAMASTGADSLIHLSYIAPNVSLSDGSISFAGTRISKDSCRMISVKNTASTGGPAITITTVSNRSSLFKVTPAKALPASIAPGDSLAILVCYQPTIAGTADQDTVVVGYDCLRLKTSLFGISTASKIFATDQDFGNVPVGETSCRTVSIKNTGFAPLNITGIQKGTLLPSFSFPDSGLLLISIQPGKSQNFTFCYTPHNPGPDSVAVQWLTDAEGEKPYSSLVGNGVRGSLVWDRTFSIFATHGPTTARIFLKNPTSEPTGQTVNVDSIRIVGPDASEFTITDNSFVYNNPIPSFPLTPGQDMWIDALFSPDTTKSWYMRHDTLIAYSNVHNLAPRVVLVGEIGDLGVGSAQTELRFHVAPNPISGSMIHFTLPSGFECAETSLMIFDALGRVRISRQKLENENMLSIEALPMGTYFCRLNDSRHTVSTTLQVIR